MQAELSTASPTLAELEGATLTQMDAVAKHIAELQAVISMRDRAEMRKQTVVKRLIGERKLGLNSRPSRQSIEPLDSHKQAVHREADLSNAVSSLGLVGLSSQRGNRASSDDAETSLRSRSVGEIVATKGIGKLVVSRRQPPKPSRRRHTIGPTGPASSYSAPP